MNRMPSDSITLSRAAILERKARTPTVRRRASTIKSKPLRIIIEDEDESSSCSRSASPMTGYQSGSSACGSQSLGLKARRRHFNLSPSEIQIARDFVGICDDQNISDGEDRLLLVPPSSARMPRTPSPVPSPNSFTLTFTETAYTFPHPPIPTPSSRRIESFCSSPTFSGSSCSGSSPSSNSAGLPPTPSSSDDEFFQLPSPRFNPRRAAISQISPLVIRKHTPSIVPVIEMATSEFQDVFMSSEKTDYQSFSLSPYIYESSDDCYEAESEAESDSEWYSNELSKVVTLAAPLSSSQNARPDSMLQLQPTSAASKRESMVLPVAYSSNQLDPVLPSKKRVSRRSLIPKYPPPPVPTSPKPKHLRSLSNIPADPFSPSDSYMSFSQMMARSPAPSPSRPPPRNSVPADFAFDDDTNSDFSFALYEVDIDGPLPRIATPVSSAYSQSSFALSESDFGSPLDQAEFDLDCEYPMMLPLSLPGTPVDLEADIVQELRMRGMASPVASPLPVVPEERELGIEERPRTPVQLHDDAWSFSTRSPAPSSASSPYREERVLKSKWSSSTLASVREEHERRSSTNKLRSYFGASPTKKGRTSPSAAAANVASKKLPATPLSPMAFITAGKKKRTSTGRRDSEDFRIMGHGVGVRRRGSVSTISDAGSEETTSSTSSSGLRRKPIPVELFMRR
ncbi:hypothetical protein FA15DRAFT_625481 [Coprinopsis marcescibilis]|uniref:Uncharacterized protein n=1 Tax=Coprinopsis marcescibilis TaxID=230819 RepID=A0A5C3KJP4_COPMA|nr:hypothetical protein FA15DRAFT_625481 [Coprinopsis marcescibilis]